MGNHSTTQGVTEGWVPQSGGRGTLDILLRCIFTIFLCCWTSICVNVPALGDPYWRRFWDKLKLALLAMLGPDFVLIIAMGQWESARQSVASFAASGLDSWTMRHAFFADMGGFHIQTDDSDVTVPVNAEQLCYLVKAGKIPWPICSKSLIDDKNKRDGLARLITVIQGGCFATIFIGRLASKLAITTLELTTLAFIFVTMIISCFWRHKPQEVNTPIVVKADLTKGHLHNLFGPLDSSSFYDHTICAALWTADKKFLKLVCRWAFPPLIRKKFQSDAKICRASSIPTDNFPTFSLKADLQCGFIMIMYSCIFVGGWNFHAPSHIEQILWRAASIAMLAFTIPGGFVLLYIEYRYFDDWMRRDATGFTNRIIEGIARSLGLPLNPKRGMSFAYGDPVRRESYSGIDRLPKWAIVYCVAVSAVYCIARIYILVEDFVGLRQLPTSTFQTVQWSQYLPQV